MADTIFDVIDRARSGVPATPEAEAAPTPTPTPGAPSGDIFGVIDAARQQQKTDRQILPPDVAGALAGSVPGEEEGQAPGRRRR